jgi:hypothetical protein
MHVLVRAQHLAERPEAAIEVLESGRRLPDDVQAYARCCDDDVVAANSLLRRDSISANEYEFAEIEAFVGDVSGSKHGKVSGLRDRRGVLLFVADPTNLLREVTNTYERSAHLSSLCSSARSCWI